jgi:hypothetical protein
MIWSIGSPPLYYWETEPGSSPVELDRLEASNKANESELEVAKRQLRKPPVPEVPRRMNTMSVMFGRVPDSYADEDSGETIDTYWNRPRMPSHWHG